MSFTQVDIYDFPIFIILFRSEINIMQRAKENCFHWISSYSYGQFSFSDLTNIILRYQT